MAGTAGGAVQFSGCLVAALDTYPLDKRCHELSRLFHELPFK
ncbi:hypothetical protein MTO96_044792, partial [Rhipicephalus appendiculatus]